MKFSIKLSTFLLLTTAPVIAEELIVLDEITVTAGYTDTGINETGSSVSVLDQQGLQYSSSGIIQAFENVAGVSMDTTCLLYTSPSPRDVEESRMPSSA